MSRTLQDMLEALDMESWLSDQGIDYRVASGSSGTQLNVRECPRCHGRSWKVYINAETGYGNCFHGACVGEPGFNKFTFIRAYIEGDSREAVREVERHVKSAGWQPVKRSATKTQQTIGWQMPDHEIIQVGSKPWNYLRDRGFSRADIDHYGWLWCECGAFRYTGPDGQVRTMDFSDRILIPVRNRDGEIVTFQGRDITGAAEKRYLFPSGLPSTGRYLYDGHHAIGVEHIVLTEGVFDCAATRKALQSDYATRQIAVVATFGKALSKGSPQEGHDQIGALIALRAAGLRRITMLWDGEHKTLQDALRTAIGLRAYGFETYVGELPGDSDPNEVAPDVVRQAVVTAFPANPIQAVKRQLVWQRQNRL